MTNPMVIRCSMPHFHRVGLGESDADVESLADEAVAALTRSLGAPDGQSEVRRAKARAAADIRECRAGMKNLTRVVDYWVYAPFWEQVVGLVIQVVGFTSDQEHSLADIVAGNMDDPAVMADMLAKETFYETTKPGKIAAYGFGSTRVETDFFLWWARTEPGRNFVGTFIKVPTDQATQLQGQLLLGLKTMCEESEWKAIPG